MIDGIRKRLNARAFTPFVVLTSGGDRYPVPTKEHAAINPSGGRVIIWFDDGSGVTVSGLHIVAIQEEAAKH